MKVIVNGQEHQLESGSTVDSALGRLLQAVGAPSDPRGVAVAVDAEVVPRREWRRTRLADGQRVEVVRATQGG